MQNDKGERENVVWMISFEKRGSSGPKREVCKGKKKRLYPDTCKTKTGFEKQKEKRQKSRRKLAESYQELIRNGTREGREGDPWEKSPKPRIQKTILRVKSFAHVAAAMQRSSESKPELCLCGHSFHSSSRESQIRLDDRRSQKRHQSTQAYNTYEPEGATVRFNYSNKVETKSGASGSHYYIPAQTRQRN